MTEHPSSPSHLADGAARRLLGHEATRRRDYVTARKHYRAAVAAYQRAREPLQEGYCFLDLAKVEALAGSPMGSREAAFYATVAGGAAGNRLLIRLASRMLEPRSTPLQDQELEADAPATILPAAA